MNLAILHGFVGNDPKIRTTESGKKVTSFSIATQSFRKDASGNKSTDWHNLIFWEKLAELCEKHVRKGSELIVHGEIQYRSYTDKEGIVKYITEIVCHNLEFAGKKESAPVEDKQGQYQGGKVTTGSMSDVNLLPGNILGETSVTDDNNLSDLPF